MMLAQNSGSVEWSDIDEAYFKIPLFFFLFFFTSEIDLDVAHDRSENLIPIIN